MRKILSHCAEKIPYYSNIITEAGSVADMDPMVILHRLPLLDKTIVKMNLPAGLIDSTRKIYFTDYTSGSSGIQGMLHSDREAYSMAVAIQMLWWQWAGYHFGDRLLQLGVSPNRGFIKGLKDYFLRVEYRSAFQIDPEIAYRSLRPLQGTKDYFFMGYASGLYEYARIAREKNLSDIEFKGVVSWGDKMFSHYRKLIEEQFNTKVFDTYGTNENTMIAAECEFHKYHIMSPHIFLEILDDNGKEVDPGKIGHVVVSRLDNYLMPLLRYKLGDLAVKCSADERCQCGRGLPLMEGIVGRDTDIVYTPDCKSLIVHFFTGIFEFYEDIRQFQIVQHKKDDIEVRYIEGKNFALETLNRLRQEIYDKAGEIFPLRFTKVEEIQATPSGKPQIVVSKMREVR
jgi:phenylacetate-CoA ligase